MNELQKADRPPPRVSDEFLLDFDGADDGPDWRDNGATDIITVSLEEMEEMLKLMVNEGHIVRQQLQEHHLPYSIPAGIEIDFETYYDICQRFWKLENKLVCSARTAALMAAIDLEAIVNKFCYYNLGETTTQAIERLQPKDKLAIVHKVFGLPDFKQAKAFAAVQGLSKWRNAFAHGHCTDIKDRSIQGNHLKTPETSRNSSSIVRETVALVECYLIVCRHIFEISKHPITSMKDPSNNYVDIIKVNLERIRTFIIKDKYSIEKIKQ